MLLQVCFKYCGLDEWTSLRGVTFEGNSASHKYAESENNSHASALFYIFILSSLFLDPLNIRDGWASVD